MANDANDERFFTQFRKIDDLVAAWSKNAPLSGFEKSEFGEKGFSIRISDQDSQAEAFPRVASANWDPLVVLGQSEDAFTIELDVSGFDPADVLVSADVDKALLVRVMAMPLREKRIAFSHPVVASSLAWSVADSKLTASIRKRPLDANEKFVPL